MVVPEGAIPYEEFESWVVGRYESRGVGSTLDRVDRERAHLAKEINGGQLLLVVQALDRRKTWIGLVEPN
jgi:hypothetical protein